MRRFIARAVNVIRHPEGEWPVISREQRSLGDLFWFYLTPLALTGPLAHGGRVLLGGDGAARGSADANETLLVALQGVFGGYLASLLSVAALAVVAWQLAPLFAGRRSLGEACRVVIYASTPLWLAGGILIAPLDRFPLLAVVILVAAMHSAFLFYLGMHHVLKVPRGDAAECTAIVLMAGILLSTVAGYYASAAGLFTSCSAC